MHINDIEESLETLEIADRKFVIGALSPLIKEVLSSGRLRLENLSDWLENFGFKTSDLEVNKIVSNYEKESYSKIKESLIANLNAIQALESFFIFFESTTYEYLKRTKLSYFDKVEAKNAPTSSIVIRTLAINLCKTYGESLNMYHNIKDIKFGSKSSISYEGGYESYAGIWLDSSDAASLLGYNWQNNINSFLGKVTPDVSNYYQIQVAILNPPFNALHVKVIVP